MAPVFPIRSWLGAVLRIFLFNVVANIVSAGVFKSIWVIYDYLRTVKPIKKRAVVFRAKG